MEDWKNEKLFLLAHIHRYFSISGNTAFVFLFFFLENFLISSYISIFLVPVLSLLNGSQLEELSCNQMMDP